MDYTVETSSCMTQPRAALGPAMASGLGLLALLVASAPAWADSAPSCSDLYPLQIVGPPASRPILVMLDAGDHADRLDILSLLQGMEGMIPAEALETAVRQGPFDPLIIAAKWPM